MRSRLFTEFISDTRDESSKAFGEDFQALLSLEDDARIECLNALAEVEALHTKDQTDDLLKRIASKNQVDIFDIERAVGAARFLADMMFVEGIPAKDAELWAEDAVEAELIPPNQRDVANRTVEFIRTNVRPALQRKRRQRIAEAGVLPIFHSLGITIEARPIRNGRYRWGNSIDAYEPSILGAVFIASIHIGLDEGNPKDFYFQADRIDLDNMIASLQAAKKEMDAFGRYLKVGEGQEGGKK